MSTLLLLNIIFSAFRCTEAPKEPENTDQKKEATVEREEADSKVVAVAEKTEKKTEEVFEKGEASTTEKEPSGAVSINGSSSDKLKESLTATAEEEKPGEYKMSSIARINALIMSIMLHQ